MKKIIIPFLAIIPTVLHPQTTDILYGISFFQPRSQSTNAARDIAGIHQFINRFDECDWYSVLQIVPAFNHSLRSDLIAINFFGTPCFDIAGSQVDHELRFNTLLADYFGLSPEFESRINLFPHIINSLIMFDAYVGFDRWLQGLYARIQAPVVWTLWNLRAQETILHPTTADDQFPAGYMDISAVSPNVFSWRAAMAGNNTVGQIKENYHYGRISPCNLHKHGLAELTMILGYNVILEEDAHLGLQLRVGAPTGNRPESIFMFEPIVGNGKHWEVGGGLSGHFLFWEKDGEQEWNFYGDINLTHLFKARQRRSFDFCKNGFFSRYLLLKVFDEQRNYTGELVPAVNVTSLWCNVVNALQMDLVALFGYTHGGFVFDIGYNGWIRSAEHIELLEGIPFNKYGIKGIQNVFDSGSLSNATQHNATIFGNNLADQALLTDPNSPVFINTQDLNLSSAAVKLAITHKIFTHIGYSWDCYDYTPFFGVGGEIEFEGINPRNTARIDRPTLGQWAIWIKGGVNL